MYCVIVCDTEGGKHDSAKVCPRCWSSGRRPLVVVGPLVLIVLHFPALVDLKFVAGGDHGRLCKQRVTAHCDGAKLLFGIAWTAVAAVVIVY